MTPGFLCLTLSTGLAVRDTCDGIYIDTLRYLCNHYMMVILLEGLRLYTYVPLLYVVCVMQKMMFQKPKKWNILHGTFCMVTFCMEHFTWQKISTVSMLGTKQRT